MNKRSKKHNNTSAPMRVLLSNRSENIIKNTFKQDTPPILSYTLEDFKNLSYTFNNMVYSKSLRVYSKSLSFLLIWTFLCDNCTNHKSMKDLYYTFYNKTQGPDFVLKQMFLLIFHTQIEKVPLFINHPYMGDIAQWRLKIKK